jgi:hypothetical protein
MREGLARRYSKVLGAVDMNLLSRAQPRAHHARRHRVLLFGLGTSYYYFSLTHSPSDKWSHQNPSSSGVVASVSKMTSTRTGISREIGPLECTPWLQPLYDFA